MNFKQYFLIITILYVTTTCIHSFKLRSPQKRIVGGENTTIYNEPFQLALKCNGVLVCGAAIIGEKYAVTAAHCINSIQQCPLSNISLVAGSTFSTTGGTDHTPEFTLKHPRYNTTTNDNDIALIKVSTPFYLRPNNRVNRIRLPQPFQDVPDDKMCKVSGWGSQTPATDDIAIKLRSVEVPIVNQEVCQSEYNDLNLTITNNMLCAGYKNGGKDSCTGDSGGPLNCDNILCGIVSWGSKCAEKNKPGVYTRVANYIFWIHETIANNSMGTPRLSGKTVKINLNAGYSQLEFEEFSLSLTSMKQKKIN